MKKGLLFFSVAIVAVVSVACSGVKVDKELMGAINDAATKAKLDMKYAFVTGPEEAVISTMILKTKGVVASLPTLSVAFIDKDPKVRVVANRYLYREIRDNISEFDKDRKATPKAAVENLIKGIETSTDYVTFYAVGTATLLSTMYGLENRLIAAVEKHPEKYLRPEMMKNLIRYGRLRVFPKLTAYAESGEQGALSLVLDSFRDLQKMTDEEKKAVGEWSLKHLAVEDPETRVRVIYALYLVGGTYYDKALDKVEAEKKAGTLPKVISLWLENMGGTETPEQENRRLVLIGKPPKPIKK